LNFIPRQPIYTVLTETATDDTPFQVTTIGLWFKELDVFCYANDVNCGTVSGMNVWILANDVYTIKGVVNAADLYFQNHTAGSNAQVVIAGTQLSDQEILDLGLA
jgi:hypothetical protein